MHNKIILNKLIKIAKNQQKILQKLSEHIEPLPPVDPNIAFIQLAWQVAAVNSGVVQVATPKVSKSESDATYKLHASNIPEKLKDMVLGAFKKQIQIQKPELTDKVSFKFQ